MAEYKLKFDRAKPYLFISYKSDEKDIIRNNVEYLQTVYGINIWYDEDLTAGRNWNEEALPILRDANCCGVLFFASELALMSPNVAEELKKARRYKKSIIPINFSEASFDTVLDEINRKYNHTAPQDVTNAEFLIDTYLPPTKTYLYLHKTNYYPELIKAIRREASEVSMFDEETITRNTELWNSREHEKTVIAEPPAPLSVEADDEPFPDTAAPDKAETAPEMPGGAHESDGEALPPDADPLPVPSSRKKPHTTTGDITFSIYGQEYTENQSNMMLTVFREVIRRHPEAVDALISQLTCACAVDYEDAANQNEAMPTYFRGCQTFRLSEAGKQICIGTSYSYSDKLKLIAKLFAITGEDPAVLSGVELPDVRLRAPGSTGASQDASAAAKPSGRGDMLSYHVYHFDGSGNQSDLMYVVYSAVLERHPDKLDEAAERLTSLSLTDYTLPPNRGAGMPPYFKTCRTFAVGSRTCCVGFGFGLKDKLIQIVKLLDLCGESSDVLQIDGLELPPMPGRPGRRGGKSGSGPMEL